MSKKYMIEEVMEILYSLGFELLSKEYKDNKQNLVFKNQDGYWFLMSLHELTLNIKRGNYPRIVGIYNPYSIQNISLWCTINKKPFVLKSNMYTSNITKLTWLCLKEECKEEFQAYWADISQNKGCPFCRGLQVGLSNCLATKRPDIASEWHSTKNGNLTPYDVTCGSHQEVWWQCKKGHEWKAVIYSRLNKGCPYCSGKLPSKDYNLLIINPELCKEWNHQKNDKSPENYTPGSDQNVWWMCKEGHEWNTRISHRTYMNSGCPECNESKGEKSIREWLKRNDINYISQKEYDNLLGLGKGFLSYDFYLPNFGLLIEYQGEFHDGTARNQTKIDFKIQQEHDRRKKDYAENNNIKLLEIWYWDFNNIKEILEKELLN